MHIDYCVALKFSRVKFRNTAAVRCSVGPNVKFDSKLAGYTSHWPGLENSAPSLVEITIMNVNVMNELLLRM